jgi:hypothetical protein
MRGRRWQALAFGIVLTPALIGVVDVAWSATASGPVTACFSKHGGAVFVPKPGKHCGSNLRNVTLGGTAPTAKLPVAYVSFLFNNSVAPSLDQSDQTNLGSEALSKGSYLVEAQLWAQENQNQEPNENLNSTLTCYLAGSDSQPPSSVRLDDLGDAEGMSLVGTATLNEDGGIGLTCYTDQRIVDVHDIRLTAVQLDSVVDESPDNG